MDIITKEGLIKEKVQSLGYDLYSLSSKKEKGQLIVSLVVDRVKPIDMEDIVNLSHALNDFFDEIDDSDIPYTLDISSLGAEKPLKVESLSSYVGQYVNIHLINPINGENIYEGVIKEVNDSSLVLEIRIKTRVKNIDILFNNIYKARLAIKF